MNLGQTIKLCRKNKGLTQAQLSDLSGISVSYICLMEKDKREPTLSTLELISKALGIPLSVLVFLAAQHEEIKELDKSQIEELSNNIMGLMDVAYRQETLF
ncbi:MAG: helix-turn-helix domain-containing protein [Candidatus Thiodiazotropha sp. (ex Dulcina madagascariensis)]|nr:helix-turn-helix domain-containing protein [Candidatus Thiodiazotropha sp. (ex Dulcina madagascariensis)]